jgi:uncharacterized membrane protein
MERKELPELLEDQDVHMAQLHRIVEEAIKEEELITENLLHPQEEILSQGQKISDKVARFGGSWKFIIIFSVVLIVWIIYNSIAASHAFDPFPFILMNLILSCIAALQAPIIMMSQNRQEEKDRQRGENDYLINMKAELEIRSLHQKIDLLQEEQIKTLYDIQAKQCDLLEDIQKKLEAIK